MNINLRSLQIRFVILLMGVAIGSSSFGQSSKRHNLFDDNAPPGAIGQSRRDLRGPVHCMYQPVKVSAHGSAKVSIAQSGTFQPGVANDLYAGFTIGSVYRLRVTEIPFYPGYEVYPTIELIDRIYPPAGQEVRFAIPIVISEDDMEEAIKGKLVTRVIYLEDPSTALPLADEPGDQRDFIIGGHDDALEVADTLGRPVAIVRFGSRTPPTDYAQMHAFLMGSPAWLPLPAPRTRANVPPGESTAIRTPHIPRIDLPSASPIPTTPPTQIARPPYFPTQPQIIR